MEKRHLKAAALAALIIVAGFGYYRWQGQKTQAQERTVEPVAVTTGTVKPKLKISGMVDAEQRQIYATGSGKVEEVFVGEGDKVTAGQKLLKISETDARRDRDIAGAALNSARARLLELKDKAASAAEISAQNVNVAKASVDYQKADETLAALTITSPIDGTVINLAVDVGDQAGGSSQAAAGASAEKSGALITIADLTKLYIKASIDQADVSKVKQDQTVKISLDALPGTDLDGKVVSIHPVPETNQNVVTYTADISLDKSDASIRLGMSADLEIDLGKKDNVIVVPNAAVRSRGGERTVTKLIDGEETEITVEVGVSDDERTEISSGLSAGDQIVLRSLAQTTAGRANNSSNTFGGGFGGGRQRMMIQGGH